MIKCSILLILLPLSALAYPDTWCPTWTNGDLIHWFIPGNEAQSSGVERCLAGDVATNAAGYNWASMFSQGSKLDRTKADYTNCIPAYVWKHLIPEVNPLTPGDVLAVVGARTDYFDPGLRVGNLAILSNGWRFIPPIATNISVRYWTDIAWTNSIVYTANTNIVCDWWYTNATYPIQVTGGATSTLDGVMMDGRYNWQESYGPVGWEHETSGWYQVVYQESPGVYTMVDRWTGGTINWAFWQSTNGITGPYYPLPYLGITNASGVAYAQVYPPDQSAYVQFPVTLTNEWPRPDDYTNSQMPWWAVSNLFPKFTNDWTLPDYWASATTNTTGIAPRVGLTIDGSGYFYEDFYAYTTEWPPSNGISWSVTGVWSQRPVRISAACTGVTSQIAVQNIWTGTPHRAWVFSATNEAALTLLTIYPSNWTYDATIVVPDYIWPFNGRTETFGTTTNGCTYYSNVFYAVTQPEPYFPYDSGGLDWDGTNSSWTDLTTGWTTNLVESWQYQYTTNWIDGGTNRTLDVYALAPAWTNANPREYRYSVFGWTLAYLTNGLSRPVEPPTVPYEEPTFITTNATVYTNYAAVTNWTAWVQTNLVVEGAGLTNANGTYTNVGGTFERGVWSVFPTGSVYRLGSNTTHYYATTGNVPEGAWFLDPPAYTNLVVTGAGRSSMNGTYQYNSTYNVWVHDSGYQIDDTSGFWQMQEAGEEIYANTNANPTEGSWMLGDLGTTNDLPAPTNVTGIVVDGGRDPAPTAYLTNLYFATGTVYSATNDVLLQDSGDTVLDTVGPPSLVPCTVWPSGYYDVQHGTWDDVAWLYSGANGGYWDGSGWSGTPLPYWIDAPFTNCYVPIDVPIDGTNAIGAECGEWHSESLPQWHSDWTDTSAIRVFVEFDFRYK